MVRIQIMVTASIKFISSGLKYLSVIHRKAKILFELVYQRENKEPCREAQGKYLHDTQMPLKSKSPMRPPNLDKCMHTGFTE